jgi:DNA-directed RNA polymerase subunit beta'
MENFVTEKRLFTNKVIDKRQLKGLMSDIFNKYGTSKCTYVADKLKFLGFRYATQAGISLNIEDLRVPHTKKENINSSEIYIQQVEEFFARADITSVDRFQFAIDKWSSVSDKIKDEVVKYFVKTDPFNPIYMMAFSGARGNLSQVRQLIGMRGLMADPQGQLIGLPIKSNFREGLTVTEYIISSYGARKGIVDTALRTADSGYLTRRLVDVSQDIIIRAFDCGTKQGINIKTNSNITLEGRTLLVDIYDQSGELILAKNNQLAKDTIAQIKKNNIKFLDIRSSITCQLNHSVCQLCYGWNLATRKVIDLGEAVGILAAQSIGEPGTQLTMRTFHTGGTFMGTLSDSIYSFSTGKVRLVGEKTNFKPDRYSQGEWNIKLKKPSILELEIFDGRLASLALPLNSSLPFNKNGFLVKANQIIAKPPVEEAQGSEQVTKRISSDKQGSIFFDNLQFLEKEDKNRNITQIAQTQGFVWVSLSDVLTIPNNTLLQVQKNDILKKNKCIVKATIHNTFSGFYRNKSDENLLQILLASYFLHDACIFKESDSFILSSPNLISKYRLGLTKESFHVRNQYIGESVLETGFKSKSGRVKIESPYTDIQIKKTNDSSVFTIHLVPEYYFDSIQSFTEIFVKAGDFVEAGTELFSGTFAKESGIVDILEVGEETFDLVLRPGLIADASFKSIFSKLNKRIIPVPEEFRSFTNFNEGQFVYVEQLVFEEGNQAFLVSCVETFVSPPEKQLFFNDRYKSVGFKKPFKIFEKFTCLVNDGDVIKDTEQVAIALSHLIFEFKLAKGFFNARMSFESLNSEDYRLVIDVYEKLNNYSEFKNGGNIRKQKLLHEHQYIYASSKSFENQLLSKENSIVNSIERISSNRRLICLAKKSDHQLFSSLVSLPSTINSGSFVRRGDKFLNNYSTQAAGRVMAMPNLLQSQQKNFVLQRAKPYLIAKNSILKAKQGFLIRKNDLIAFLTYEVAKTEDIIQGLPRVEEILEARPPKNPAIIATIPGYISVIQNISEDGDDSGDLCTIVVQNKCGLRERYTIPKLRRIVKSGDFVHLGGRLTDGQPDLRELLKVTFNFYRKIIKLNNYISAIKSFRHLQLLLISEIQNVYKSQGVDISDKHIEIIVRQMTTKVKVEDSGKTTLVPGELVDLEKIRRINAISKHHGFETATYVPTLLGITKASLSTDSFISAASFQETARVLTKAAVEGKKDWLKGLKENVIVGRLIPAGTGYRENYIKNSLDENIAFDNNQFDDLILDKRVTNFE